MPITAPLARNQKGEQFDLPDKAVEWEVRNYTGGRPTPFETSSGERLFVPIMSGDDTLREQGCSGPISLLAVDAQRKAVGAPAAYIDLGSPATDERKKNGHNGRDSLVDALVQSQLAMQRSQAEAYRASALRERAASDAQIATMQVLRDVIADLAEKVRPVDAHTIVKEHTAIQKMLAPRTAEIIVEEGPDEGATNGKEPPEWAVFAAKAPMFAEFVIPKLPNLNPTHAEWIRTVAGVAAQAASFVGGANGTPPSQREIIDAQATVTSVRELPRVLSEVIVRMPDGEAEAFHRFASTLDPHAFAVLVTKASAMSSLDERIAFVRGRMNGNAGAATPAGVPPGTIPRHVAEILEETAAHLSPEDRQEFRQIVDSVPVEALAGLAADLSKLAPTDRPAALSRGIAKLREMRAKTQGQPPPGSDGPPNGGGERR